MRYEIYTFPSLYGEPTRTNSSLWAYVISAFRLITHPRHEIRAIDTKTNTAFIIW